MYSYPTDVSSAFLLSGSPHCARHPQRSETTGGSLARGLASPGRTSMKTSQSKPSSATSPRIDAHPPHTPRLRVVAKPLCSPSVPSEDSPLVVPFPADHRTQYVSRGDRADESARVRIYHGHHRDPVARHPLQHIVQRIVVGRSRS